MAYEYGQFLIYWIIRILVFLSFVITGYWISFKRRPNQSFWGGVAPLVLVYSLAEGLRWNRGTDYYSNYLELTGAVVDDMNEFLYSQWLSFVHAISLPYWVAFVFYSFILICAFLCLIKRFPKIAYIALPMFFLITSMQSENLVRQFFSLSFIIFALVAYLDKRFLLMALLLAVSEGFHFSALMPISFFLLSIFLSYTYKPKKPIIPVALFVVLYLFWDASYFASITDPILKLIPETDSKMDSYVQSATWFNEDGSLSLLSGSEYSGRSLIKALIQFPTYLFIIIGGFYATYNKSFLRMCFWCAYIALLLDITRGDIQSYLRFYHWVAFMISIVIGLIYSELRLNKAIKTISMLFLFIYYVWGIMLSNIFVIDPCGYAFVWDR